MLRELRASSVDAVSQAIPRREASARQEDLIRRLLSRAMQSDTHIHTRPPVHVRSKSFSNVVKRRQEEDDGRGDQRKTATKRERGQRESPGKPATVLDGRRDHTLTSTTFREPPPGTYLTFNQLHHLILLHLHARGTPKRGCFTSESGRRARDSVSPGNHIVGISFMISRSRARRLSTFSRNPRVYVPLR